MSEVNETVADVIVTLERYIICELRANDFDKSNIQHIIARLRRAHGKEVEQYAKACRYEVCNMQKAREAVKAVVDVGYPHNFQKEAPHIRGYCYDITRAIDKCFAALSAPPRNCDKYSHDEALRIWSSLPESKENACFDVWLYADAKGDAK